MLQNLFKSSLSKSDIYFHMCLESLILMAPSHSTLYTKYYESACMKFYDQHQSNLKVLNKVLFKIPHEGYIM